MTHALELLTAADPLRALAPALVGWWLRGALLLVLGGLAARLLARRSAATRHLAWSLTFAAALSLPAVTALLPPLGVSPWPLSMPLPGFVTRDAEIARPAIDPVASRGASGSGGAAAATSATSAARARAPRETASSSLAGLPSGTEHREPAAVTGAASPAPPVVTGASWSAAPRSLGWSGSLLLVWLAGAALLVLGSVAGRLGRRRLLAGAGSAPAGWLRWIDEAPESLRVRRRVRLLLAPAATVPMTWGVLRPTVVLPAAARSWSGPRLCDAVLHELAHVRRLDALTQAVAELLAALAWIDPLVWMARRALRRQAEHACDDAVLAAGSRASRYAGHLLEAARGLRDRRVRLPRTAVAMARPSGLSERIGAVLDERRRREPVGRRRLALGGAAALAVVLQVAALVPVPAAPAQAAAPGPLPEVFAASAPAATPAAAARPAAVATADPAVATVPGALALAEAVSRSSLPAPAAARSQDRGGRPAGPAPAAPPPPAGHVVEASAFSGSTSLSSSDQPSEGYFTQPRYRGDCKPGLLTGRNYGSRVHGHDDLWQIALLHGSCSLEIELRGDVRFAADDRGIERLGRGAEMIVEEDSHTPRKLVISAGPGGEPRYELTVDGERRPFDAGARGWLAEVLPEVFRATGFRAPERVARMLPDGGVAAVLAEMRLISSDYVQRIYGEELLRQHRLTSSEAVPFLAAVGDSIGSDYDLAELLTRFPSAPLAARPVQAAFVEAVGTIGSDYEAARVLKTLLERRDLAPATIDAVIAVTAGIGSDYDLAETLLAMLRSRTDDEPVGRSFFTAAATIGSDYDQARVLRALVDRGHLDAATVDRLLRTAEGVGSDYDLAELLVHLAQAAKLDGPLRQRYLETAKGVGSSYEHERVLTAVGEPASRSR